MLASKNAFSYHREILLSLKPVTLLKKDLHMYISWFSLENGSRFEGSEYVLLLNLQDFVTFHFWSLLLSGSISSVGCSHFPSCIRFWCSSSKPFIYGEKWNRNFRSYSIFNQLHVGSNSLFICHNICDKTKTQDYKKVEIGLGERTLKPPLTVQFCIERKRGEECQAKTKPDNIIGWVKFISVYCKEQHETKIPYSYKQTKSLGPHILPTHSWKHMANVKLRGYNSIIQGC